MTFACFIKKYYLFQQQEEIISTLNNLSIYNDIETVLNEFYREVNGCDKNEFIIQFVLTTKELLTTISIPIKAIKTNEQKAIEHKIIGLMLNFTREAYQFSSLTFLEYSNLLVLVVKKTYSKILCDFSALKAVLEPDHIKLLIDEKVENKTINVLKPSKPIKLDWNGKKHLDLFIDDLTKTFQEVKSKKKFYLLFDEKKTDFKIELHSKNLLPFLILFQKLHDARTIIVIGNRGLFVYLQQHLQAPPKDAYPKRDFRKLRHEANQNEQVINKISGVIKPILDKYCGNVPMDNRRTIA